MITPVTSSGNIHANTAVSPGNKTAGNVSSQPPGQVQDKVELSSTAQAKLSSLKAALQEASETPAQTAQEAQHGDLQARRLLAKEAQAHQNSAPITK